MFPTIIKNGLENREMICKYYIFVLPSFFSAKAQSVMKLIFIFTDLESRCRSPVVEGVGRETFETWQEEGLAYLNAAAAAAVVAVP